MNAATASRIANEQTINDFQQLLKALRKTRPLGQAPARKLRDGKKRAELSALEVIEAARTHTNGIITWDLMAAIDNSRDAHRDAPWKLTNQRIIELAAANGMDATEIITGKRGARAA